MKWDNLTYGNTVTSGKKLIEILMSGVCDSCYYPSLSPGKPGKNLFGRTLSKSNNSDPNFVFGTALTGLRSALFLDDEELNNRRGLVHQAVRSHVPLVIHSTSGDSGEVMTAEGCFQFFATNHQDLIDFNIVAHKVAEQLLVPGVVIMDQYSTASSVQNCELLNPELIREFLGRPEDRISSPTPAQQIIFGPNRRRIPNWFNYDNPVAGTILKDSHALTNERVANQRFFYSHSDEIISQVLLEYSKISGRTVEKVSAYKTGDAKYVFITQGSTFHQAKEVIDYLRSQKIKAGCANLNVLGPFPTLELSEILEDKKAVAILDRSSDPMGGPGVIYNKLNSILNKLPLKNQPQLFSAFRGRVASDIKNNEIVGLFEHMISGASNKNYESYGEESLEDFSKYPILEAHLQNVDRQYPQFASKKEDSSKLNYKTNEEVELSAEINSSILNTIEFSENFLRLLAEQYDASVYGLPKEHEYLFCASKVRSLGSAILENNLDVYVTDSRKINSILLQRMKRGGSIIFLSRENAKESLSLSNESKDFLEKMDIHLLQILFDNKSELIIGLSGILVNTFNASLDFTMTEGDIKELRDSFYSKYFTEIDKLDEEQFKLAFRSAKEVEEIEWIDATQVNRDLPLAVRRYKDHGIPFTRLAQFYNYTTHFIETGNQEKLLPEPFQAVPFVPAAASDLLSMTETRQKLPQFKPESCTGCSNCFVLCPHSAIPPISIHVETLLRSAMSIAGSQGQSISKFTPLVKNLAKLSNRIIGKAEAIKEVSDFLPSAFAELIAQMKPDQDKLEILEAEFKNLMDIIGSFQVSSTDSFFKNAEMMEKGSGELFSLAIDSNACTGCGICEQVCPDEAIEMVTQKPADIEKARSQFNLWEQLPDTSGETLTRLFHDDQYNTLGSILLSRNFYLSLVGPSFNPEDHSIKTMVHLVTAVTESIVQPQFANRIEELSQIIESLSENIHSKLSNAIPRGDLDTLLTVFKTDKRAQIPLDNLLEEAGLEKHLPSVNAVELQRKIELLRQLKNLQWLITEGPTGTGRARFGATISNSEAFKWAANYPANNFCSPLLLHWSNKNSAMALGLFEGNLQHQLDNIKLLRRATLEIKDAYVANEHDEQIASLNWNSLTDDEKGLIPPMILFTDVAEMDESSESLNKILHSDYPVKVIVMNQLSRSANALLKGFSMMLDSLILGNKNVYQASLADQSSFAKALLLGMKNHGPALFHIGLDEKMYSDKNSLSCYSRVFPVIMPKANADTSGLSSKVDLTSNPDYDKDWATIQLAYIENREEAVLDYQLTGADWFSLLPGMKSHFKEYSDEKGMATPVPDYIAMEDSELKGRVPVITKNDEAGLPIKLCVSEEVIRLTKEVKLIWDTWKEIAGESAILPDTMKLKIEKEISNKYKEEIERLKSDHDKKIKQLEDQQLLVAKKKLVDKFLYLYNQSKIKENG